MPDCLICLICLQQLLKIPLRGLFLGILVLATILILVFSGGSAVAFNARIGREEMREEAAA